MAHNPDHPKGKHIRPLIWEDIRFCPRCGQPYPTPLQSPRVCPACRRSFYPDPRLVACAVLWVDGAIALVRRTFKDTGWMLPGGHVDRTEKVEAALIREIAEETGITASVLRLLDVFSQPGDSPVLIVYEAQGQGIPRAQGETASAALFFPTNLPWEQLASAVTAQAIARALGLPRTPKIPYTLDNQHNTSTEGS